LPGQVRPPQLVPSPTMTQRFAPELSQPLRARLPPGAPATAAPPRPLTFYMATGPCKFTVGGTVCGCRQGKFNCVGPLVDAPCTICWHPFKSHDTSPASLALREVSSDSEDDRSPTKRARLDAPSTATPAGGFEPGLQPPPPPHPFSDEVTISKKWPGSEEESDDRQKYRRLTLLQGSDSVYKTRSDIVRHCLSSTFGCMSNGVPGSRAPVFPSRRPLFQILQRP